MPIADPKSVLDTSKMSPAQREALELTEAARESAKAEHGFAGNLFMGHFDVTGIHPFPVQDPEDVARGDLFLQRLRRFPKRAG